MKKVFIATGILCAALLGNQAKAQTSNIAIKLNTLTTNSLDLTPHITDETDITSVKISAFSGELIGSFKLNGSRMLRVGLGYNMLKGSGSDSFSNIQGDKGSGSFSISRSDFSIIPGIAQSLVSTEKYDFYTGLDLPITLVGKSKLDYTEHYASADSTSGDNYTDKVNGKLDGGVSLALRPFLGFRYMVTHQFSIGAELAIALKYSHVGTSGTITYYEDGQLQEDDNADVKISSFSKMPPSASINLAYHFGK